MSTSRRTQTPDDVRRAYDAAAEEYAAQFLGELVNKPKDRRWLEHFAERVKGGRPVLDLGCGPGQTTAFLHALAVPTTGVDLSGNAIAQARKHHPDIPFRQGNMLALDDADRSAAGVLAFYAIVNFTRDELAVAMAEIHRVLRPGGHLLFSFHIGSETRHLAEFLGKPVPIDFQFFEVDDVESLLATCGFEAVDVRVRDPYPDVEHPSRRAYVFAQRPVAR